MPAVQRIHSRETMAYLFRALQTADRSGWVDRVAYRANATQITEEYVDLGMVPSMRQWLGGRAPKTLREEAFSITNLKYESSVIIPRDDLILEKSDLVQNRINSLAQRAGADHWHKLLTTVIEAGESTACYDAQFFFDTDHSSAASGSQSNDISADISAYPCAVHGSTTAPSPEEMGFAIMDGIIKILGFKDDQGEPMNDGITDFSVMVPLSFLQATNVAVSAQLIGNGATNQLGVQGFSLQVIPNVRSTWTTKFAIFANNASARPLIAQELEGPRLSAKAEGSDFEHDNDAHEYGVSVYRAAGYGAWSSACLVTLV